MSKTSSFLGILYRVSLSPGRCLPEGQIRELMGYPSKSTWHRQINELLVGSATTPALLIEVHNPDGDRLFCLNTDGWQSFLNAHDEGKFLLECYRKIGHLLESDFTNMVFDLSDVGKKHIDRLGRKFMHLVRVKALQTAESKQNLDLIISALVAEKLLEVHYEGERRLVRPLTLCQHRDELYLMCYRQKEDSQWEKRTYKLARMSSVSVLEKKFPYPPKSEWDPSDEFEYSSGIVLGEVKQVQIKVHGHSRKIIQEKEFFNGKFVAMGGDGDVYVCTYTNPAEFLGQIFVYAQDIEILDDLELATEFVQKAEQALKRNRKKTA